MFDRIRDFVAAHLTRNPGRREHTYFRTGRTAAGVVITPDTAFQQATVWAAHRYLTQTIGQLPARVMRERADGFSERVPNHPANNILTWRVNPEMSPFQFKETMVGWAVMRGNGVAEIERDAVGRVAALWPINPDRLQFLRDTETDELIYRVNNGPIGYVDLRPADVFHLRGYGHSAVGLSVVEYAAQSIGWARATELFGAAFFGEGMHFGGAVLLPNKADKSTIKRMRAELDEIYRGPSRAGKWFFGDGGATVQKMTATPDEAQFVSTMQHQVEEICRWMGVPPQKVYHLLRMTFCLPAASLIFTESGPKRIADVVVGERVWSRDVAGRWGLSDVERSGPTGIDRILKVRTTNRTVRMNAKHRVLARRRYGTARGYSWRTEYVPAGQLRVGDTVVAVDRLPDLENEIAPNGRHLTPGFMAFCGLLLGDGNVFAGGMITVARATNVSYMDYYREVITAEFTAGGRFMRGGERHPRARLTDSDVEDIRIALVEGQRRKDVAFRYEVGVSTVGAIASGQNWGPQAPSAVRAVTLQEHARKTNFRSVTASEELLELGFGGNARTKRVPGWVYGLSTELRLAFIAGFLDADGTVDKAGRMSFHSVGEEMLAGFRHLCMGLGIPVTNIRAGDIRTTLPNGIFFQGGKIFSFTCSDPGQNRRVPTATPVYKDRMEAGKVFSSGERSYPRHGGKGFDEEDCALSRIAEITEEPAEVVYDLTVSGTHNFIADGVVVHNSNVEQLAIEVVQDSITPWCVRFEEEANFKLFGQNRQNLFVKLDLKGLLRGDFKSRQEGLNIMRNNGVINSDYWAEIEDMPKIGSANGGDKYIVQAAMTELKLVGTNFADASQPQQPAEPTPAPAQQARVLRIEDYRRRTEVMLRNAP